MVFENEHFVLSHKLAIKYTSQNGNGTPDIARVNSVCGFLSGYNDDQLPMSSFYSRYRPGSDGNIVHDLRHQLASAQTDIANTQRHAVMWSETVGLRTRPVSETKKVGLGLARCALGRVLAGLCCETRSCYARRHNDLEGHSNFSSTIYSFSVLCLEHHYRGDQQ